MEKIALIPAYEPDENLLKITEELLKNKYTVIVINDGSSSKYDNIFSKISKKVKIISYNLNHGKGYALKTGFNYINDNYKDYICITMDSDGQHTVEDANKLYEYNINHLDELILGKRVLKNNIPFKSKIGNNFTRFIYKLVTKKEIYDTQTGLRSFSKELMPYMLKVDGDRYEYEMNVLLGLKDNNIDVHEIDINTIYIDNNSNTHFNPIKDSYKIYKQIIKYAGSSLISFVIDYLLYLIFTMIFESITLSNVLSRIISASLNYNINEKLVFESNQNKFKSVIGYILLATLILLLNTTILNIFVNALNINKYLAKVVTEITLFILSYSVQKNIIFKKEDDSNKK